MRKGLYERLREEHYLYCQGLRPSTLKACCRYIEGCLGLKPYMTQHQIMERYKVNPQTIWQRYREICDLLGIEREARVGAKPRLVDKPHLCR